VLTVPVMFVTATRALTPLERISWIAWSWSLLLMRLVIRFAAQRSVARARAERQRRRARAKSVFAVGAVALVNE
jgi:hypothetical protein